MLDYQPGHGLRLAAAGEGKALRFEGLHMEVPVMLRIYPVVLQLVREVSGYLPVLRARSASLADQFERALVSIPLNVAEGDYSRGGNRLARFSTAAGSAREALACLETAEALGWVEPLKPELGALFHQVIGTLVRLIVPRP